MPRSAPTASATWRASPVIIATLTPSCCRSATASRASGADLVLQGERPDDLVVAPDQVEHRGAALLPLAGSAAAGRRAPSSARSRSRPGRRPRRRRRRWSPRRPGRSAPGTSAAGGDRRRARSGGGDDGPASGCSLSDSTPPASRSTSSSSRPPTAATPVTTWAPLVRVPVLSNSTASTCRMRSSARRSLTRMPALADTAVDSEITSGMARPRACGQAMTSTVTVRTTASSTSPSADPGHERDDAGGDGDVEQQRGEAVGERLGPAAAGLGLGHQALDAGQRGVVADRVDPHPDRRVGRHRAGDHPVAAGLGTGRDSPVIIDSSSSAAPSTITPSAGTRPPGAPARRRRPAGRRAETVRTSSPSTTLGLVGQQLGQRRQGAPGLADRLHLLPVAEQHDRDQRRQLPPELEVEPVEAGGHRRHVGDGDRHRDQQHHPGLAVADLGTRRRRGTASRPTRTRSSRAPGRARRSPGSRGVAEPVHHHLAGDDERDRQHQAQPGRGEDLPAVAGVLVVADMRRLVLHVRRRVHACRD